jgi:hypothetical protein
MQYRVTTPILNDGKKYQAGEHIELPKDQAEALIKSGSIEPIHAAFDQSRSELKLNLEA